MADGERATRNATSTIAPARRYAAFVSYSHIDDEIANWLHRRLEAYRVPAALSRGRNRRRLGKIFRDRVELSAAHDLGVEIHKALEASDALIVLCSPRSAQSRYVEDEIRFFKQLGRGQQIFAAIVDGEPHAAGKPGRDASEECFPRALLYRVGADGLLSSEPELAEPIAADVRKGKDGRENGALKLVAGLLDVGLDELVQREKQAERQRRRRANLIATAMAVLALGAAGAGAFAWQQQGIAVSQRVEADKQRDIAEREAAGAAERYSDLVAAKALELDTAGSHDEALLMSLYADPAAQKSAATRKYDGMEGYPSARAVLSSSLLSNRLQGTFNGHTDAILSVAYSQDGKRILTGSRDRTARVWDAKTKRPLLVLEGHAGLVSSVAFAPDGKRAATGSDDGTTQVWDAESGKRLLTLRIEPYGPDSLTFSPDSKRILTGSANGVARVWDAYTGRPLFDFVGHTDIVDSVAFSPDGKRAVTGSRDKTARLWNAESGISLIAIPQADSVASVAFSPEGKHVLTGLDDGTARVWNSETGASVLTLKGHSGRVNSVGFSQDGKRIITGSDDKTARVWNAETGKLMFTLAGHADFVSSVAYSPNGRDVLTGSFDMTARVWDVDPNLDGDEPLVTLDGRRGLNSAVAVLAPDGERVLSGADGETAWLRDAKSGKLLLTLEGHAAAVQSVAFSANGKRVLTGSWDNTARIWDAESGKSLVTLKGHSGYVSSVAFSLDGKRILTGSWDGTARVWDAESGDLLLTLKDRVNVTSVAFSPDGKYILTGTADSALLWDAESGRLLITFKGHHGPIWSVAFSPDGKRVLAGSGDQTARVWSAETGKSLFSLEGHSGDVASVAFSPDGKRILTGSANSIRVWDAASGTLLTTRAIPGKHVTSVSFYPDSKHIFAGSADVSTRTWALPAAILADSTSQVKMACEKLWRGNTPLAFSISALAQYQVLQGEPVDPDNPNFLVSPCQGLLPAEAIVKPVSSN